MKSDMLKRFFRAVALNSPPDLVRLCQLVVEDEQRRGHGALADQLQRILDAPPTPAPSSDDGVRALSALPRAQRTSDPLVTFRPTETLRYHMVLPHSVEGRFIRIENEYAARDRLNRYGFTHKRRVLLYGPPGCGKSMGAERLAYNTGLPFFRVRFDALISSLFGESATNLRRVFEMADEQPCLLCLDECDFIARSRKATNDVGEVPRIVNTLLQLMEDFEGPGLFVAATNLTSALDEALFRRFDDVLEVPLPGKPEVRRLLEESISHLQPVDVQFDGLVDRLVGRSAAEIVKVAQDACKLGILEGRNVVTNDDFQRVLAEMATSPST